MEMTVDGRDRIIVTTLIQNVTKLYDLLER